MIYIALIGLTLIIVRGTIFGPLQRLWPTFFQCGQCVGMWVGMAAGASDIVTIGHGRVLDAIIVGGVTSILSLLTAAVLLKLDE
ncbi:hypothetical protein LCGC14_1460780 [marine sediment metagenome]|uniref:Uncharacterized protein n=1 Tax=marine sediment metagenome TaxID=412755 RepID=A0A0F9K174_9ZZZZ